MGSQNSQVDDEDSYNHHMLNDGNAHMDEEEKEEPY
jgi:nitrogen fixation-related uncharacterized protein